MWIEISMKEKLIYNGLRYDNGKYIYQDGKYDGCLKMCDFYQAF